MSEWIGWHFLAANRRLQYGKRQVVEVGQTLTITKTPRLCQRGFHASKKAIDALYYAPGPIICRVTLGGVIVEDQDKAAGQSRTVLAMADASDLLHDFACWCADVVLPIYEQAYPDDHRPRQAIAAKRQWLRNEISGEELAAARAAARSAAEGTARAAARAAAKSAAEVAVWAAARGAAWAAAAAEGAGSAAAEGAGSAAARGAASGAARAAAAAEGAVSAAAEGAVWDAARGEQNTELERRFTELLAAV